MTYEEWGPLGGLVGTWESDWTGLDVAFHNDQGKIAETPFREKTTFKPFGPVANGDQNLYGLDYRTAAYKQGEDSPFHTEVGYWMWDSRHHQVMRCFTIPRASTLIAGGTVQPDATTFKTRSGARLEHVRHPRQQYLDEIAKTTRFDVTVTIEGDTFTYDETTVVEHQRHPAIILHTDRNTLKRTSWEA